MRRKGDLQCVFCSHCWYNGQINNQFVLLVLELAKLLIKQGWKVSSADERQCTLSILQWEHYRPAMHALKQTW